VLGSSRKRSRPSVANRYRSSSSRCSSGRTLSACRPDANRPAPLAVRANGEGSPTQRIGIAQRRFPVRRAAVRASAALWDRHSEGSEHGTALHRRSAREPVRKRMRARGRAAGAAPPCSGRRQACGWRGRWRSAVRPDGPQPNHSIAYSIRSRRKCEGRLALVEAQRRSLTLPAWPAIRTYSAALHCTALDRSRLLRVRNRRPADARESRRRCGATLKARPQCVLCEAVGVSERCAHEPIYDMRRIDRPRA
jgi:hypothetical protein